MSQGQRNNEDTLYGLFRMNAKTHHTKSKVKEGCKLANGVQRQTRWEGCVYPWRELSRQPRSQEWGKVFPGVPLIYSNAETHESLRAGDV